MWTDGGEKRDHVWCSFEGGRNELPQRLDGRMSREGSEVGVENCSLGGEELVSGGAPVGEQSTGVNGNGEGARDVRSGRSILEDVVDVGVAEPIDLVIGSGQHVEKKLRWDQVERGRWNVDGFDGNEIRIAGIGEKGEVEKTKTVNGDEGPANSFHTAIGWGKGA